MCTFIKKIKKKFIELTIRRSVELLASIFNHFGISHMPSSFPKFMYHNCTTELEMGQKTSSKFIVLHWVSFRAFLGTCDSQTKD